MKIKRIFGLGILILYTLIVYGPYFAIILGVLMIVMTEDARARNGEFIVYEILCLRCNKKLKSRINYLVDLRYLIHRVFCRARAKYPLKLRFLWVIMSLGIRTEGISSEAHRIYNKFKEEGS